MLMGGGTPPLAVSFADAPTPPWRGRPRVSRKRSTGVVNRFDHRAMIIDFSPVAPLI